MVAEGSSSKSSVGRCCRAFWEGLTRPHGGTAAGALTFLAFLWIFLALSSTEAHVRATDLKGWVGFSDESGWNNLNATTIQGAAQHASGQGRTVVLIGSSILVDLLPPRDQLSELYVSAGVAPVRVVGLAADALSPEESAAVVDKFGADFDGWFVIHVNRHALARDTHDVDMWKKRSGAFVAFYSDILADERRRSGHVVPRQLGIPLLDFPKFYLQSLGGWRSVLFPWKLGFRPRRSQKAQRLAPTPAEIVANLPLSGSGAQTHSFDLLGRVAERLRANGRARLAIVEVPFADEFTPEVQTEGWRAARAKFIAQRKAWSKAHGVPWLDVTDKLQARPEDFVDPRHLASPAVSRRFTTAVLQWLAEVKP